MQSAPRSEIMTEYSAHRRTVSAVLMALGFAFSCASAHAACDLIPQAQQGFRGDLGTINRPFASPGDVVELDVRQALCDGASMGLLPTAAEHLVTVVFQPPGGTRRAVVLAADCSDPAVQSKLTACNASLSPQAPALCMDGSVANRPVGLAFKYRGTQPHLTFRFPNTDELFAPAGDGRTLSGSVAIGVTGTGPTQALPCDLSAALPCRNRSNLIACIDSLYAVDGTCVRNPQDVDEVFSSFTALPPPNDYQRSCFSNDPPCDPLDPMLQIAIDRIGNMLIPMDWRGVLANQPGVAIPRLLRATIKSPVALTIPSPAFLHSFTPDGAPLPPIFEPQADETAVDPTVVTLFGSVDAPTSVLRIAHNVGACVSNGDPCATVADCHGATCARTCNGGTRDGLDCATSGDCPGGVCPVLYDDAPLRAMASQGAIDISRVFVEPRAGTLSARAAWDVHEQWRVHGPRRPLRQLCARSDASSRPRKPHRRLLAGVVAYRPRECRRRRSKRRCRPARSHRHVARPPYR